MKVILWIVLPCFSLLFVACPMTENALRSPNYTNERTLIADNHAYEANIRTVQLYRGDYELSYPVIYLNDPTPLSLEFDELLPPEEIESKFYVDFVNCDANWNPTNLLPIEFFEGFSQDQIDLYRRSEFTKISYFHYTYQFPKPERYFKISGNYLIKVYRNGNPKELVLTRRFIVVDRQVNIEPKYLINDRIQRLRLQELAFDVNVAGLEIINPAQDLQILVMQNFRWDNAVQIERPRFSRQEIYEYYINLIAGFNGGNEFRWHDIRSTRFYSESMRDVTELPQHYEITLYQDDERLKNSFGTLRDRNGGFFIEVQEWPNAADYSADYVMNKFRLKAKYRPNDEVYILGSFTDWQARPEFRMDYNESQARYEASLLLKQGVYDYQYASKAPSGKLLNEGDIEGKALETENYYNILIYYRAPTDRTDRIIGFLPLNYYD